MQTTTKLVVSLRVAAVAATLFILLSLSSCKSTRAQSHPLVVAHRGGSLIAPENTLAAFEQGIAAGSDAIELDLHLSSDGELIVIHDARLDRTTAAKGAVRLYPKERLERFDATASYRGKAVSGDTTIPTFAKVLDLVALHPHLEMQVEIKTDANKLRYPEIEKKTIAALQASEMLDRTLIISFDLPTLETIKTLEPGASTGLLVGSSYLNARKGKNAKEIAQEIIATGVDGVGIDYRVLSSALYRELRTSELIIGVWTVNSEKEMQRYIALGVDFITTDDPPLLISLL